MRVNALVALTALIVAGCACSSPPAAEVGSAAPATPSSSAAARADVAPSVSEPSTSEPATTTIVSTSTTAAAVTSGAQLDLVGSAGQAIVVTASGYGATTATFTAYRRTPDGWQEALGPWTAWVGSKGLAPPGEKREGDGRTPSGVYGFGFLFGVQPDPGVRFPYRQVTPSIVWDDDPASPSYNQWVDTDRQSPGTEPERMYQPAAYAYGAVIAYNTARTPGLGSAIFLHVSTGGPTAGCVSLRRDQLLDVLRWLDPAQEPRIVMGVA